MHSSAPMVTCALWLQTHTATFSHRAPWGLALASPPFSRVTLLYAEGPPAPTVQTSDLWVQIHAPGCLQAAQPGDLGIHQAAQLDTPDARLLISPAFPTLACGPALLPVTSDAHDTSASWVLVLTRGKPLRPGPAHPLPITLRCQSCKETWASCEPTLIYR